MTRGVSRAFAYLPRRTEGGLRHRGPDEDAFTLAAAALEGVADLGAPPPGGWFLRPCGDALGGSADGLAALLPKGSVARTEGVSGSAVRRELSAALADSVPTIVVGTVLSETSAGRPLSPPGEGAFALCVEELEPSQADPWSEGLRLDSGSEIGELTSVARETAGYGCGTWAGDWWEDPGAGDSSAPNPPRDAPPAGVSEGAYVPLPAYRAARPSRWRLEGAECRACGTLTFPARDRCRQCGRADELVPRPLPRRGLRIRAVTRIGSGGQPTEFDAEVATSGPYRVVLVELLPGVLATMMVAEAPAGTVRIGALVDSQLRRLYPMEGAWRYGRKAVPVRPVHVGVDPPSFAQANPGRSR